jgi:RNA-directed DNA polymerase
VALRVGDQPVLKLLRAMLRAGVMEDGQVRRDTAGTAQGGVISPVMCNVYLRLSMVRTDSVQASFAIRAGAYLGSRFTGEGAERVRSRSERLAGMGLVALASFLVGQDASVSLTRSTTAPEGQARAACAKS